MFSLPSLQQLFIKFKRFEKIYSTMSLTVFILLTSATLVMGQRPFFAGSRPIGFPDTPNRTTTIDPLADRYGEGTTVRLPIEANGDRELVDRLSKLPIDKQPFWFINWQAVEANINNPQTYPQKPNVFIDPLANNFQNSANTNSGIANRNGLDSSIITNLDKMPVTPLTPEATTTSAQTYPQKPNVFIDPLANNFENSANTNTGIDNRNGLDSSTIKNLDKMPVTTPEATKTTVSGKKNKFH